MTLTPQDFVSKWKRAAGGEKQSVQEHFLDLCQLVGHPTPVESDPSGKRFSFEMGAAKTGGGQGWADVAKLGYFGWEYKGKDSRDLDLTKAYTQLLRYRDALQNPPLLIVSDIDTIIIRTNYTNLPTRTITLTLDDLLTADGLKTLKAAFFNPDELKPRQTVQAVTEQAATQFSDLATLLRKYGEDNQKVAHFLIRLLFCLFAEDVSLLPDRLFPRLLEQTRHRSKDFMEVLRQLFRAMNTGGYFGADRILFFNGGLFDNDYVLELDSDGMDIVAGIDALDWAAIEPSIFGTLFERGLDPSKRSQLGAHYTSKKDILLIVEPVLMAPLRREWEALKIEVTKLKAESDQVGEKKKAGIIKQIGVKLRTFADKIATIQVLDPACGSGNFLYVALRLLLDLQNEVINLSDQLGAGRFFISVSPAQLHGIEINEYAHELAQITIWIGYIQWLVDNGYGLPAEPILKPMQTILQMDAILTHDEAGNPVEPEWPPADVIIGNPPFLGDKKMRAELGDRYVDELRTLYGNRIPGQSDLVCYWFEKARAMIETGSVKRAGLLATQGIRGGANRRVLERIKESGDIFWSQSDLDWVLDGATVHVSMVGFDNGTEPKRELDGEIVETINADLSSAANISSARTLAENQGISFIGTQKSGPFDLDEEKAKRMILGRGNPNGCSNRDVIKPWINALDITQEPRKMWIIDFGADMKMEDAAKYELPFEYVRKNVKPLRDKVRRKNHRVKWWLFGESRPGMRRALAKLTRFIVTPMVSKHRIFAWVSNDVIPENLLVVIARSDDYFIGILHSHIHEIWSRSMGSQLREAESGQRYTPTTTFETFPFPWPPGQEPQADPRVQAIARAALDLVEMRDRWLHPAGTSDADRKSRTLTNLYNQHPTWLELAHRKLDAAVCAAYGWPDDLSDELILEKLLALNLERAKSQSSK
jgi:type II restriction/modification system DNA methylase subunit YeeA